MKRTCPGCRSTNLRPGTIALRQPFVPEGSTEGWGAEAFACSDCGLVSRFLNEAALRCLDGERFRTPPCL